MASHSIFSQSVLTIVSQIPRGKVMTYGQIAAHAGSARSARIVGGIAHYGDPDLPWQRVVNKVGALASGYPGGRLSHRHVLEEEGVRFIEKNGEYYVDMADQLWQI